MITDILNTDKRYITQNLVQNISTKLGETQCSINMAFSISIPTIFSGILKNSHNTEKTLEMLDMITSKNNQINTDFLYNPEKIYADNENILKKGKKTLEALFSDTIREFSKIIRKSSGVKIESAKSILEITMVITMASLGIKANSEGWNSNELINYVIRNQNTIKKSTPEEIKKIIAFEEKRIEEKSTVVTSQKTGRKTYWLKYIALALLAILLLFLVKQGCSKIISANSQKESHIDDPSTLYQTRT